MKKAELVVLETSDIHGNIYPINYGNNSKEDIGLGKIATLIQKERQKHENLVLIDNGDLIQGTPLTYHYVKTNSHAQNPMTLITNELGYDAAVFGNHEFNYGQKVLRKAMEESRFPWLSANILDDKTGEAFYGQPYIIKELPAGIKVGILGLTTPYIPNWEQPEHIEGIRFSNPVEEAKKWVSFLREDKQVDIVVVSYHGGFERDLDTGEPTEMLTGENQGYQLCQEVEGMDVLLTGHQHRQIEDKEINGVIVVQPGNKGLALGKVTLQLEETDNGWECIGKDSELIYASEVEADQKILALTDVYEKSTQEWLDQPIGKIDGDMLVHDPLEIRLQDSALIEFINHVQMVKAGVTISNTALFDNTSPGLPENVTMRDIVSNYMFPNTLKVIRITGQDMKEALERSASYFKQYDGEKVEVNPTFIEPKPQHYNYDMWEGIDYVINISRPVGERIVKLEYEGKPVVMDERYDVVMNNYRAGGGGDYFMYKDKPVIKEIQIDVSELLANYFLNQKIVKATVDNNWHVTHD